MTQANKIIKPEGRGALRYKYGGNGWGFNGEYDDQQDLYRLIAQMTMKKEFKGN